MTYATQRAAQERRIVNIRRGMQTVTSFSAQRDVERTTAARDQKFRELQAAQDEVDAAYAQLKRAQGVA